MRKHLKTLTCTSFSGFDWCQKSLREGHCDSVVHVYYHHALWASPRGVGTSPDKGIVQVHTLTFVRLLTKLLLMLHACHLGATDHSASTLKFVATEWQSLCRGVITSVMNHHLFFFSRHSYFPFLIFLCIIKDCLLFLSLSFYFMLLFVFYLQHVGWLVKKAPPPLWWNWWSVLFRVFYVFLMLNYYWIYDWQFFLYYSVHVFFTAEDGLRHNIW